MKVVSSAVRLVEGLTPVMAGWSNHARKPPSPSGRALGTTYPDIH